MEKPFWHLIPIKILTDMRSKWNYTPNGFLSLYKKEKQSMIDFREDDQNHYFWHLMIRIFPGNKIVLK